MPKHPPRTRSKAALDGLPIPMATDKPKKDPRRQFYPLAKNMKNDYERILLMCKHPAYYNHEINRHHILALDEAFWIHFEEKGRPSGHVSLKIEVTEHGNPTGDGLKYWWPVIQQWRELLLEWQHRQGGVTIAGMRLEAELLGMRQRGDSSKKISDGVNQRIREARQKEADLENHPFSPVAATIPGLNHILQNYKLNGSADEIIKHFTPKPMDADDSETISESHIREHLRYRRKNPS